MPPRKRSSPDQADLFGGSSNSAPAVPGIRHAVQQWREQGLPGITDTTRNLLSHWFPPDPHRLADGRKFEYYASQREAIETLIYLYEVEELRRQKPLLERFVTQQNLRFLQHDEFARYCLKMATGTGKTKVMSLAIAWQYFNAVAEGRTDCAQTFLLIAPNVIVFERLQTDFANGRIFKTDPVIPDSLRVFWDMQFYMRGDGERAGSQGALYLTNIHQLYDRDNGGNTNEPDEMTGVLGPRPPSDTTRVEPFDSQVVRRGGPVMVLNDEAHHTHDEKLKWTEKVRELHSAVDGGLSMQLDFTATPRHGKGALFSWTVFDYPLKQAINDNVVKRPIKGITKGIAEGRSEIASTRFQAYLTAGVNRWQEYREQLELLAKKPILFVMMNSTKDADDVGDWLRSKYPTEFGGDRLLTIHTDRSGEVSKRDVETARQVAREVDDEKSPVNCIVSVLMLREGWDVQNVTVVVGLRPYSSKADILPEQTIGRGLRLMFRGYASDYIERVDIIGNKLFMDFLDRLEREEDLELDTFDVGTDRLQIVTIAPDMSKLDKDISIPVLSPILTRKKSIADEISSIDVMSLDSPILPVGEDDAKVKTFTYEGFDFVTLEKLIERKYEIPEVQTPEEVIGHYAKLIAQDIKLPSQFAVLAPRIREFLERKAFGEPVDLAAPGMVKAISTKLASYVTTQTFVKKLREFVTEQRIPHVEHGGKKLSDTEPFPFSRATLEAPGTVFNLVPCDNDFEYRFATFLRDSSDVDRFAKLPEQYGFFIEYTDSVGNLRHYEPDWAVVTTDGEHYLCETKGREDVDVQHKDHAARLWCEAVTDLTDTRWQYAKVLQKAYDQLQPTQFAEAVVAANM